VSFVSAVSILLSHVAVACVLQEVRISIPWEKFRLEARTKWSSEDPASKREKSAPKVCIIFIFIHQKAGNKEQTSSIKIRTNNRTQKYRTWCSEYTKCYQLTQVIT